MRPKERIPIFLKNVDWDKLADKWNLSKPLHMCRKARTYWEENPDQRVGQVLINLQLVPDKLDIWTDEELSILLSQGCNPRDVVLWGVNYDKDRNKLPTTEFRLVRDMDTDHIETILKEVSSDMYKIPQGYIDIFNNELIYRKNQNSDEKIQRSNNIKT